MYMYLLLLTLYLLVECNMCRYKLDWGWLSGVAVGESRSGVGQLIQVCLI